MIKKFGQKEKTIFDLILDKYVCKLNKKIEFEFEQSEFNLKLIRYFIKTKHHQRFKIEPFIFIIYDHHQYFKENEVNDIFDTVNSAAIFQNQNPESMRLTKIDIVNCNTNIQTFVDCIKDK